MVPQQRWFRQCQKNGLLILCTLSFLLNITPISLAGYKAPSRPSAPKQGTTTSKGVRGGCENETKTPLTALAPTLHIGQTTSTHPTIAWFAPEQKVYPIELTVFEENEKGRGKPIYTTTLESASGITAFSLPPNHPGLTVGKQYIWQVAIICNPNRPSQDRWVEMSMTVAPMPTNLKAALASTNDPLKRADLYAESGFWYDALAETFKTPTARSLRLTLLQQLSQLESPERRAQLEAIISKL